MKAAKNAHLETTLRAAQSMAAFHCQVHESEFWPSSFAWTGGNQIFFLILQVRIRNDFSALAFAG